MAIIKDLTGRLQLTQPIITPGPFRFRYLLMVLAGIATFVAISIVVPYLGALVGIAITVAIFWICIEGKKNP